VIDDLRARALPLAPDDDRRIVPEPFVKAALEVLGVAVPRGTVVTATDAPEVDLAAPLVLKAFGAGIVHKTDVGAVHLGLTPDDLVDAAAAMTTRLEGHGLVPAGFLLEETARPGVELVVGATRTPLGVVVLAGLGGIWAEVLDDVAVALAPLDRAAAEALLDGFRGAAVLAGTRGGVAVDRTALVDLLLAVAGPDGLVARCSDEFAELDCNPVVARPDGATVLDARLVLRPPPVAPGPVPALDPAAVFAPRVVGIAGVSTSGGGFGNRALAALRGVGRGPDDLVVVHPSAAEVDGVPAVASVADVAGGVDYLLVAVPAAACPDLVRSVAGHTRVVHVVSGGFGEAGPDGAALEDDLLAAAREAGVRLLGPNCIGVHAPAGRQAFQLAVSTEPGGVHVTSQSGGLAGDVVKVGAERGLRFAHVVSVGNAVDVTPTEVLAAAVADPAVRVVGAYLEGARGAEGLADVFRAARGRTPVVVLTGGLTAAGGRAATSHTGALAGDRRVWDAVRRATNVAVVDRLEDLVGALVFAQAYADHPASGEPATLLVGVGGGASVLGADACDRAGLHLTPVAAPAVTRLRSLGYGAGTSVVNPIEIGVGPAAPVDVFDGVFAAILPEQPYPDVICHVNVQSYYGYGTGGTAPLCDLVRSVAAGVQEGRYPATRVVLVARNLDVAPGPDADAVLATAAAVGLPLYRTFDEAAVAVAAGKEFARGRD